MLIRKSNSLNLSDFGIKASEIDYKEFQLSNGLKVILCKNSRIPMISVNTAYHVGSKDEDETQTGIAHLFEHLMFEGSLNVKRGQFDEILNQRGGDSNAYTSWDITGYYTVVPSHELQTALWLESDRMLGFGVKEESLKVQKDVVAEEKMTTADNVPYGSLEEESSKRLFKKSGYRWPIIGYMDRLRKVTLNDIKNFYYKFYVPNNAVLAIVGDIDYDVAENLVRKYYEEIPSGKYLQRQEFCEEDIQDEIRDDIFDNVHLQGKFIFYRVPKIGTKDFYAMQILNDILTEGESSRFYKELIYKSNLCSEADSFIFGMENLSLFYISAIALHGKSLDDIEAKVNEILESIKQGYISECEIIKIKNKLETVYNSKKQSIISLGDKLCFFKTFYDDTSRINTEILSYLSITKEDIIETACKFLNKNQRLVLNYLPKNGTNNYRK